MRNIYFWLVPILFIFLNLNSFSQSLGDYRSKQTGNWADATSWEYYDGSAWGDAGTAPSGASGTITIQSSHIITSAAAVSIASGTSVIVNGYLKATAAFSAPGSAPYGFTFNNGSTYEHALAGGSIPMSNWNTGSTCLITGTTGGTPNNTNQNFYHFTWNCPNQSTSLNLGWDNITIGGNVTVTSSAGTTYQMRMTNSSVTLRTITINGDIIVNGGFITATGSGGAAQYNVTVKGNITMTSGKIGLSNGSGGVATWRLLGNLNISGGQFVVPSNTTSGTRLIFAATNGSQSYTLSGSGTNSNLNYGIENNTTVTLNSPLNVGNTTTGFLVLTGGKFVTTSTNKITLAVGASITTGSGYVSGPLTQTVNVNTSKVLSFPLGKSSYRPVTLTITQDGTSSTTYTGEIFDAAAPANTLPVSLDAVSSAHYYHFVKGSGAGVSSASILLSYDSDEGSLCSDKDMIRVAKDDGAGSWVNLGGSGTANTTGTITSNLFGTSTALGTITTSDFTLAHLNPSSLASPPTLSTNSISYISTESATSGGVISNDGNAAITAKGVCWNTASGPTTDNGHTSDGTTATSFTSSITGLSANTTYYVRAYATNSAGTSYGNEITFTTLAALSVPTLTTNAVTNIVNTTATGGGTISAWGGSAITDRGVCWSTNHNPTLANDFNSSGAGYTGSYSTSMGGLALGTTYYVRAYATNSSGTVYGDEVSFSTPAPQPDVLKIVAQDGSGDYTTVYDAFMAVPTNYTGHWFIYVKAGTYYDKITLSSGKINVVLIGQDTSNTILTYDDYAENNRTTHGVTCSGTSTSYSVAIDAADFQAQNITFQNTSKVAQAVALRTNGDRQSYYNCRMLGYQDTYYTQGGMAGPDRIYNSNCYVRGSVDFVFGRDVVMFDNCTIFCNRNGGTLTAASTESGYTYGYVFKDCTIGSIDAGTIGFDGNAMSSFYLGRPWQASPKTVFINCSEPATLNSAGWLAWNVAPSLYAEYGCSGPGSSSGRTITWPAASQPATLTAEQAANYTIANIFSKNNCGAGYTYAANWTPQLITYTGGPLPVELASFTAVGNSGSVLLNWETASEQNSNRFEIERKDANSGIWKFAGSVTASGNSNTHRSYSFLDEKLDAGKYSYRLKTIDNDGSFKYSSIVDVTVSIPLNFDLSQNYPNPFNPSSVIYYTVPLNCRVSLKVYDILGNEVGVLVDEIKEAGTYNVKLSAVNYASGVYMYQLKAGNFTAVKKFTVLK